jgi:hypothetical protein
MATAAARPVAAPSRPARWVTAQPDLLLFWGPMRRCYRQVTQRAAAGAIAGGLRPTTEHTAATHLPGAITGVETVGVLSGGAQLGGTTLRSIACADPLSRFAVHAALVPPLAHAIHSSTGLRYDYSYEIAAAVAWVWRDVV